MRKGTTKAAEQGRIAALKELLGQHIAYYSAVGDTAVVDRLRKLMKQLK